MRNSRKEHQKRSEALPSLLCFSLQGSPQTLNSQFRHCALYSYLYLVHRFRCGFTPSQTESITPKLIIEVSTLSGFRLYPWKKATLRQVEDCAGHDARRVWCNWKTHSHSTHNTQHTTHSVALHWVAASLSSPVFERVLGVCLFSYTHLILSVIFFFIC